MDRESGDAGALPSSLEGLVGNLKPDDPAPLRKRLAECSARYVEQLADALEQDDKDEADVCRCERSIDLHYILLEEAPCNQPAKCDPDFTRSALLRVMVRETIRLLESNRFPYDPE